MTVSLGGLPFKTTRPKILAGTPFVSGTMLAGAIANGAMPGGATGSGCLATTGITSGVARSFDRRISAGFAWITLRARALRSGPAVAREKEGTYLDFVVAFCG